VEFSLPEGHAPGMRVPKGGSSCANCRFYGAGKCGEPNFVAWSGGSRIPAPSPDEYCSDWWQPKS
jgi:hypothetical protein